MIEYKNAEAGNEDGVPCVRLYGVTHFGVREIFDCGQAFRFDPVENTGHGCEWCGVARGRFISVASDGDDITIYNSSMEDFDNIWKDYFALEEDYGAYADDIRSRSDVPALKAAVDTGRGIRILHQEPWEALCSFIISQNNNIPRIKALVRELSRRAGERIDVCGMEKHGAHDREYAFPSPAAVASLGEDGLRDMKTGFRAGYIYAAACAVRDGIIDQEKIKAAPTTQEASLMLQSLRGVGPKVAACTLLFGYGRMDSFPVDVWIKKVIEKYFTGSFSPDILGPYAGLAQQYLFYYEREI